MKEKKFSNRNEYFNVQIKRSREKFSYCKVSVREVLLFKKIIQPILGNIGPILCLGTRNGREIDVFRNVFFANKYFIWIIRMLEITHRGYHSLIPFVEGFFRSQIEEINDHAVIGVEINPDAKRQDVLVGSFDEMPGEWSNNFSILFSNSFDQSQDAVKTADEWKRVVKKKRGEERGVLILGFNDTPPTESDPIGNVTYTDLLKLFEGELIYFIKYGLHYSYVIIQF